jgi:hypothetical protein
VIGFVIARGMDVIKAKQAERACETESESVAESVCE